MQKPTIFRIKHLVLEMISDFDTGIAKNLWNIYDDLKLPTLKVRTDGLGLLGEDNDRSMICRIEGNRSGIDIENIPRIDAANVTIGKFGNTILKHHNTHFFKRLGIRIFVMALTEPNPEKKEYVRTIANFLPNKSFPSTDPTDAGFFVRFAKNDWSIRFGLFSSDDDVMKKYHRIHSNELYTQPCAIYDLDFYRTNLQIPKDFDMKFYLNEVYALASELIKINVDEVWK